MSVPKGQQSKSNIEFYVKAEELHDNIIKFLINDFGIKDFSKDAKIFANTTKMNSDDAATLMDLKEKYNIDLETSYPQ